MDPSTQSLIAALPCWRGRVTLTPLHGGLSNESFRAEDGSGVYVARFGRDFPFHHVSRAREAAASRWAAAAGLSPAVHYAEGGCLVLRFIEGRTLAESDIATRSVDIVALLSRAHAEMAMRARGDVAFFWVFQVLRDYADALVAAGHAITPELPRLMDLAARLEQAQPPVKMAFGHHDLLPGNFLDDGQRLWLIDWEYAAFGTPMFDLANLAANGSFDDEQSRALLEAYFGKPSDEALWRGFTAMRLASALREWLWYCVSEVHLQAPGADYRAYAASCRENFEAALARAPSVA